MRTDDTKSGALAIGDTGTTGRGEVERLARRGTPLTDGGHAVR